MIKILSNEIMKIDVCKYNTIFKSQEYSVVAEYMTIYKIFVMR